MIPNIYQQRIQKLAGKEGERWLAELPADIAWCIEQWQLHNIQPVANLAYNYVATACNSVGQSVVLKMGIPNPEFAYEVAALQVYDGKGAVRVLAVNHDKRALLLEHIQPGRLLRDEPDNRQAATIAAYLMRDLPCPVPNQHTFRTVASWIGIFRWVQKEKPPQSEKLPANLLTQAQELADHLIETTQSPMLLHGDLHHDNILFDQKRGWLAIDPKGVVGDPVYEVARFLHNPIPDFLQMPNPIAVTKERVEIIAGILNVSHQHLLGWALVDCVLSACWSIEDGENCTYAIRCAELMATLVQAL